MARLFFALWPDAAARRELALLAQSLAATAGGRPVPAANLHLTLAFLGDLSPERAEEAIASRITAPRFHLEVDEVGAFRAARVAWIGPRIAPPALAGLQARLEADLRRRGFALDARPFKAHVTLARGITGTVPPTRVAPIGWEVASVALVRTRPGTGRYATVREWGAESGEG